MALAKSQSYVIALKEWSTEFFYNNANSPGSPLEPVLSAFTLVGCASGESVAALDETIYWVSRAPARAGSASHGRALSNQNQHAGCGSHPRCRRAR